MIIFQAKDQLTHPPSQHLHHPQVVFTCQGIIQEWHEVAEGILLQKHITLSWPKLCSAYWDLETFENNEVVGKSFGWLPPWLAACVMGYNKRAWPAAPLIGFNWERIARRYYHACLPHRELWDFLRSTPRGGHIVISSVKVYFGQWWEFLRCSS